MDKPLTKEVEISKTLGTTTAYLDKSGNYYGFVSIPIQSSVIKCNRTACKNRHDWYYHVDLQKTEPGKFYCASCAFKINRENGKKLCVSASHKLILLDPNTGVCELDDVLLNSEDTKKAVLSFDDFHVVVIQRGYSKNTKFPTVGDLRKIEDWFDFPA